MEEICISELIQKLQEFQSEYGDMPVTWTDGTSDQLLQPHQFFVHHPHFAQTAVYSPLCLCMRMEPTKAHLNRILKKLEF